MYINVYIFIICIYMYIYVCVCVFIIRFISFSFFARLYDGEENGGSLRSVERKRRSSAEREGTRGTCGRTIDNRHEARTSGNNGKFDERIDACIVYRSIAIVCRKQYLSLSFSFSLEGTRESFSLPPIST